jgi:hypothetical protein
LVYSLCPNSIDFWVSLEQKFHHYFFNGEVELRFSDLTSLRQKYIKTVSDYLRWFREVRNTCYNLTIAEKDLAALAFTSLTPYLKDKLDGQEFFDTNQLLHRALPYENRAKSSQFQDNANKNKEKHQVHFLEDRRVNRPDVLHDGDELSRRLEQTKEHIMMVGSWPCKVSSELYINGRRVSKQVREDKGKATVLKSEDEKDPKRACKVLSKGHEVVGPGYSRLSGDAARVTDKGEVSGNPNQVGRVC